MLRPSEDPAVDRLFNVEIKARCPDPRRVREALAGEGAAHDGVDPQVDTYFGCADGRLKLRESRHGDSLIHYRREDRAGPKDSDVLLEPLPDGHGLKEVLSRALGVRTIVEKERDVYRIDNVKFHVDRVPGLGEFVEIEAIDADGSIGRERLLAQCRRYMALFGVADEHLETVSYCDLIAGAARQAEGEER